MIPQSLQSFFSAFLTSQHFFFATAVLTAQQDFLAVAFAAGFVWAITLLTYLLPPATVWSNLIAGTSTPNQARFLVAGTVVFTLAVNEATGVVTLATTEGNVLATTIGELLPGRFDASHMDKC